MTGVIYQRMLNLKISFYSIVLHTLCRLPQLSFYLSFLCCSRCIFLKRDLEVSQGVCEKLLRAANIMEDLKSLLMASLIFVAIVLFICFCSGNELNDVFCTILNVACDTTIQKFWCVLVVWCFFLVGWLVGFGRCVFVFKYIYSQLDVIL